MHSEFISFLESIENIDNKGIISIFKDAYTTCFESHNDTKNPDNLEKSYNDYTGPKEIYLQFPDITVYLVDGSIIRRDIDIDFIMGDNGFYDNRYIPKNEVWIEFLLPVNERQFITLHELTEIKHMAKGMRYLDAHKIASKTEQKARRDHTGFDFSKLIPELNPEIKQL